MAPEQPYCRLTVLAPRHSVDVALPADVPVAELTPMVLELVGEPAPGTLRRPEPWRLTGAAGGPLPGAATLSELGVLDGEMLRIGPWSPPPAGPVFDDPVDAVAATAGRPRAGERHFGASAVLATAVATALLLAWPGAPASGLAAALAAAAAGAAIAWAARLVRLPAPPDPEPTFRAARTAALAAVALAAAAGWSALTGTPGAALLLAAAAAGAAAATAQVVLRIVAPSLVGAVTAAVLVAGAALVARFGVDPVAAATGAAAIGVVAGPMLPRAAIRLAGLPRPVVPADAGELVEADSAPDLLHPEELAERADLARGYLAGLAGGCAVVSAAGALVAAADGGWVGPVFAGVAVAVLALRSRSFADVEPARVLLMSAIAGAVGLAAAVVVTAGPAARPLVGTALLAVVAAGTVAVGRARPIASPVSRRAIDLFEGLLVAVSVPLAFGAMDLFAIVRGL